MTVNEETTNPTRSPERPAVVSTILLVAVYVLVATAAIAFAGTARLADQDDTLAILGTEVLGGLIAFYYGLTGLPAHCTTAARRGGRCRGCCSR